MGIGDMMAAITLSILVIVSYPALLVLLSLFFQTRTQKARIRIERGLIKPFFTGVIVAIPAFGLAIALISAGSVFQFLGVVWGILLLTWGAVGIAGMAQHFGYRLMELSEKDESTLKTWLSGGIVITLAMAFPIVGWFFIIPLSTLLGVGAATLSLFTRIPEKPTHDDTLLMDTML